MRKKYLINFRFNHFDPSLYVSTANIDNLEHGKLRYQYQHERNSTNYFRN